MLASDQHPGLDVVEHGTSVYLEVELLDVETLAMR
jgi:hypothetical protein